jgi:hypothetical protein
MPVRERSRAGSPKDTHLGRDAAVHMTSGNKDWITRSTGGAISPPFNSQLQRIDAAAHARDDGRSGLRLRC